MTFFSRLVGGLVGVWICAMPLGSARACDRAVERPSVRPRIGLSLLRSLVRRPRVEVSEPAAAAPSGITTAQFRQLERLDRAILNALALDTSCVKVVFLDGETFERRYRAMSGRVHAHGADEVAGFHMPGLVTNNTVFVRLDDDGVAQDEVVIHELLHAMSRRFSTDGDTRHYTLITEGITEWFTRGVLRASGAVLASQHVYFDETEVAGVIAERVGKAALRRSFFFEDFDALAARVNRRVGPGSFYAAARAIEQGELGHALDALR